MTLRVRFVWCWLIALVAVPGLAFAGEADIVLPEFTSQDWLLVYIVLGSAFVALLYGWHLARKTTRHDPGSREMQEVSAAIQEGAMAYLGRQVRTMILFVIIIAIGLFFLYRDAPGMTPALAGGISLAFLMGVFASYGAGYVGMGLAVRGNTRVANAALFAAQPVAPGVASSPPAELTQCLCSSLRGHRPHPRGSRGRGTVYSDHYSYSCGSHDLPI